MGHSYIDLMRMQHETTSRLKADLSAAHELNSKLARNAAFNVAESERANRKCQALLGIIAKLTKGEITNEEAEELAVEIYGD